jgi:hypothetical protein
MSENRPGALVALRDRREAVIQLLTDSFANDIVNLDEFDTRIGRAHAAATVADLDALVADLVPLPETAAHVVLAKIPVGSVPDRPRTVAALFSNVERSGVWQVPSALAARSTFGNLELDFREAHFAAGVTELRVRAVFGNVEIVVPPHLAVESDGSAIFGNFEQSAHPAADPDRPLLRIIGKAVFGNVEVRTELPSKALALRPRRT